MQNKPNLLDAQMNLSSVKTMNYEQITMNNANKKQSQTNPIQTRSAAKIPTGELLENLQTGDQSNPISVQKTRVFANFLPLFTHFCRFSVISINSFGWPGQTLTFARDSVILTQISVILYCRSLI